MIENGWQKSSKLARAKLNLCLRVVGKSEGRHRVESVVAFTSLADRLDFVPDHRLTLKVRHDFAGISDPSLKVSAGETNLVRRAVRLLDQKRGVAISLRKRIPPRGGLGGGSADAAVTLQTLNRLWECGADLQKSAKRLGEDVGLCLHSPTPGLFGADGGRLKIDLPDFYALLLYSPPGLATERVYAAYAAAGPSGAGGSADVASALSRNLPGERANDWGEYLSAHGNSLTAAAVGLMPSLAMTINFLKAGRGCLYAGMSGSGATCFGLYETETLARAALSRGGREAARISEVVKVYGFKASMKID